MYMATMSACHLLAHARPHDVVHLTSSNDKGVNVAYTAVAVL